MKNRRLFLMAVFAMLPLLAVACNLSTSQSTAQPTDALSDEVEPSPEAVDPTPEDTQQDGLSVVLDVSGVAEDFNYEVIPGVPFSTDRPWWDMLPEHIVITLEGYPVGQHLMQPQIFIYPVQGLNTYENVGNIPADLEALLQSQQPGQNLPYLPFYNAGQVMHAQVKFMDFQSGSGVRYLTQFDQAVLPINNNELLYTYQGLTSDGNYYVAAVLPLNMPGLPEDANVTDALPPEFFNNFPQYMANMVTMLNQAEDSVYNPDLSALDAMVQSIAVE